LNPKLNNLLDLDLWGLSNKNIKQNNKIFIAKHLGNVKKNIFYSETQIISLKPSIDLISKLNLTNNLSEADYVLVPHPWIAIYKNKSYLSYLKELSIKVSLLVANTDDISPTCNLQNTIQFRTFLHPKENSYRKIIVPYPSIPKKLIIREWEPIPTISFIGYVPKLTLGSLIGRNRSFLFSPIKSSVYLNRKISSKKLENLNQIFEVICIKRKSFTLLPTNVNLLSYMNEFENNLLNSDYVLCPRGFGNTSIRFYETLSTGATPILINTESEYPKLKSDSFWNNNILVVNLFENWSKKIIKDWNYLSLGDNYTKRQLENYKTYTDQLDLQKYSEIVFKKYLKV
jgi:hypothetical protein